VRVKISRDRPALAALVATALATAGLAGCSAGSSLLDSNLLSTASVPEQPQVRQAAGKPVVRMVAYRPPLGPPENVAGEFTRQLNDAAGNHGIALVIDPAVKPELALRGYVTAMRKGPTVNITYLWDVLDTSGKRVARLSGEEMLKDGVNASQPWDAMTPVVAKLIAEKTMSQLARWVNGNGPQVAAGATGATGAAAPPRPAAAGLTSEN
jgi:hypothetical protein